MTLNTFIHSTEVIFFKHSLSLENQTYLLVQIAF